MRLIVRTDDDTEFEPESGGSIPSIRGHLFYLADFDEERVYARSAPNSAVQGFPLSFFSARVDVSEPHLPDLTGTESALAEYDKVNWNDLWRVMDDVSQRPENRRRKTAQERLAGVSEVMQQSQATARANLYDALFDDTKGRYTPVYINGIEIRLIRMWVAQFQEARRGRKA